MSPYQIKKIAMSHVTYLACRISLSPQKGPRRCVDFRGLGPLCKECHYSMRPIDWALECGVPMFDLILILILIIIKF